jgi:hypothetical protein
MRLKTVTSLSMKPFSMHPNSALRLNYFVLNGNFEVAKCFLVKQCLQDLEPPSMPPFSTRATFSNHLEETPKLFLEYCKHTSSSIATLLLPISVNVQIVLNLAW